jgi:hypothetical protein
MEMTHRMTEHGDVRNIPACASISLGEIAAPRVNEETLRGIVAGYLKISIASGRYQ